MNETPQPGTMRLAPADDAPVVIFVQQIINQAVALQASDVHFEPDKTQHRVRMRIDGQLHEMAKCPPGLRERLAARIKVMARLDVTEKRLPQDGRIAWTLASGAALDLRVSTLPTLHGEKVVVRILDANHTPLQLEALGYEATDLQLLHKAIARPHGLVLVTGPTGSGKTQSLYACLNRLNTGAVNICTVEDPCEIQMEGVNQVNVHDKPGLDFALVLRAFLRQDPDIVMVGEMRDAPTAHIAIQAAQTGHLVLSTLHTNDAPATLVRLRNMGVAAFNVAASVTLITAQRLVRRLCVHCKRATDVPLRVLVQAGLPQPALAADPCRVYAPQGCDQCHKGFRGRTGIFQVMPISARMQELIVQEASAQVLAEQAALEGVGSLRAAGLRKVLAGETSLDEVLTVTQEGA